MAGIDCRSFIFVGYFFLTFVQFLCVIHGQTNVALTRANATCTASQTDCQRAIDGFSSTTSNIYIWGFRSVATGTWIKVTFNQQYTIYTARFMQMYWDVESNFKDLTLTFSDGSSQQVTLSSPVDGFIWDTFNLTPVSTTSVDVLVVSSYSAASTSTYNGFQEVEFYDGVVTTTTTTSAPTTTTVATITTPTTTATTTPTTTTTTTPTTTTTTPTTTTTTPTTTTVTTTTTTPPTSTTTTTPTTTTTSTTTPTTTTTTTPTTTTTTTTPTTTTTTPTTTTTTSPTTTTTISTSTTPTTTTTVPTTTTTTTTVVPTTTTTTSTETSITTQSSTNTSTTTSIPSSTAGSTSTKVSTNNLVTYIILGLIGLLIVGAGCILVFVFLCRGNRRKKKEKDIEKPIHMTNGVARPHSLAYSNLSEVPSQIYDEPDTVPRRAIPVSKLGEVILKLSNEDGYGEEFREIPSGETAKATLGKRKSILKKNRFNNIFPFDSNRVKLSLVDDSDDSDYINASYMHGYKKERVFIAAQGPNQWTLPDFWRMIWEKDCPLIVMLTNLMEKGKNKCDKYWPTEDLTFGIIHVKIIQEEIFPQYTTRVFEVTRKEEKKIVKQYHFTVWPDEGVPDTGTDVLAMLKRVNEEPVGGRGPIVVHCSAGVGRTGTFIALDYLQREAAAEGQVDVFKCIHNLRADRMNTIQSLAQYRFIYLTLLEALECEHVSTPCDQFSTVLPLIKEVKEEGYLSIMEKQFKILDVYKPGNWKESCIEALREENADKNRDMNILPSEFVRPDLSEVEGRPSYINATFVKGYKNPFAHIVTQMPLENTSPEFWRLVMNYQVPSIVMLNEPGQEKIYWPRDEAANEMDIAGLIKLKTKKVVDDEFLTVIDIHVEYVEDENDDAYLKLFQMKNWPTDGSFPEGRKMLDMYHRVTDWQRKNVSKQMIIHCMNGCDRSGLFCAVHFIVEKIKNEQEVDIFNAVKQIRQARPEFVPTLQQYEYLYSVAVTYLELFDDYANFKSTDIVPVVEEDDYIDVVPPLQDIPEEVEEVDDVVDEDVPDKTVDIIPEEDTVDDNASIHHLIIEVD